MRFGFVYSESPELARVRGFQPIVVIPIGWWRDLVRKVIATRANLRAAAVVGVAIDQYIAKIEADNGMTRPPQKPGVRPWPTPFVEVRCPRCDVPVRVPRDVFDTLAVHDDDLNEVLRAEVQRLTADLNDARKAANDYHRRAQQMAAALSKTMEAGGPSFGRALANAGHAAQRTLRETADAQLAVYRARYDGDLTPEEEAAAFAMEEECGHHLSWAQRDRVIREIRRRRQP